MSKDPPPSSKAESSRSQSRSFLSIPPALKRLFDQFPLVTYAANELPSRSVSVPLKKDRADIHAFYDAHDTRRKSSVGVKDDALHAFFSWAGEGDVSPNVASFNPQCLRWQVCSSLSLLGSGDPRLTGSSLQAYLVFQGIKFHVVPSNNHASFPHSLPLVASHPDAGGPFVQPIITSEGLGKWAKKSAAMSIQEEAFMALVDGPIRRAWVLGP